MCFRILPATQPWLSSALRSTWPTNHLSTDGSSLSSFVRVLSCHFVGIINISYPQLRRGLPPNIEGDLKAFANVIVLGEKPILYVKNSKFETGRVVGRFSDTPTFHNKYFIVEEPKAGNSLLSFTQISCVPCQDVTAHRDHRILGPFLKRLGVREGWRKVFIAEARETSY